MTPCSIKNCERPRVGRGYCMRHWQQWKAHGAVRTEEVCEFSPIILEEGYAKVGLLDTFDNVIAWTLVSLEDLPLVEGKKLRTDKGRYAAYFGTRTTKYLHRSIVKNAVEVDHINGDGLDNRRENLRPATHQQNCANKTWSSIKGVRKRGKRFEAYISDKTSSSGVWTYLGMYDTEKQAASAYNKAALQKWGDFANLNDTDLLEAA